MNNEHVAKLQTFFKSLKEQRLWKAFVSSITVIISLLGLCSASIDGFTSLISSNLFSFISIVIFAAALFYMFAYFFIFAPPEHAVDAGDISCVCMRFACSDDMDNIHKIARSWFAAYMLIGSERMGSWLNHDNKTFRVAELNSIQNEKIMILGYYIALPISMALYYLIIDQRIKEKEITPNLICKFDTPSTEAIYIVDIAKVKDAGLYAGWTLIADLLRYISKCFDENINIKVIGAWAISNKGKVAARKLNMSEIKTYRDGSIFFEMTREKFIIERGNKNSLIGRHCSTPFQENYIIPY
ncbi:MAG: hypothetical protein KF682_22225 [Nitrospira sp.]|nr:hypothetical protein [Nitrospira sp.]